MRLRLLLRGSRPRSRAMAAVNAPLVAAAVHTPNLELPTLGESDDGEDAFAAAAVRRRCRRRRRSSHAAAARVGALHERGCAGARCPRPRTPSRSRPAATGTHVATAAPARRAPSEAAPTRTGSRPRARRASRTARSHRSRGRASGLALPARARALGLESAPSSRRPGRPPAAAPALAPPPEEQPAGDDEEEGDPDPTERRFDDGECPFLFSEFLEEYGT